MDEESLRTSHDLLSFIAASPTAFHAVREQRTVLEDADFTFLPESSKWRVERGGRYYTIRNGSSIVALSVGKHVTNPQFLIAASHTDSPMFKIKAHAQTSGPLGYAGIDTEVYGGMIDRTWLDRPLTVAGRVLVKDDAGIRSHLICPNKDLLLIPSLAIHLNRSVNEKGAIDRKCDIRPLLSAGLLEAGSFDRLIASEVGVEPEEVLGRDLFVVNRQQGVVWGAANEFVSAPRLDDLQCAFSSLRAFAETRNDSAIAVHACFDSEEVGSGTMQGAQSTFLPDVLRRVCAGLGMRREEYFRALARSFMVSCDNAQALHPNHPELYDEENRVRMNGGVVIKEAANQKYATDGLSRAVFARICERAGVPTQAFANRSDIAGGSTLGNLAMRQASMHTVDVGLAQLAMHSAYETAGARDTSYLIAALKAFFASTLEFDGEGNVSMG